MKEIVQKCTNLFKIIQNCTKLCKKTAPRIPLAESLHQCPIWQPLCILRSHTRSVRAGTLWVPSRQKCALRLVLIACFDMHWRPQES